MPGTLTRSGLGRRAAYAESPEAGVTEAFDAADFRTTIANGLSVASGALRCTVTVNDPVNRSSQSVTWEAGGDALGDVLVQAVLKSHSLPNSGLGIVARSASFGQGVNRVATRIEGVSLTSVLTAATGGATQTDAVAAQTLAGYRVSLAVAGTQVDAYHFPTGTTHSTSTTQTDGYAGLYFSAGSLTPTVEWSAFTVCGRYLTVSGLPSGWSVQLLDAADSLLISAAESSGIATIDCLAIAFPDPRKIAVLDETDAVVLTQVPSEGVWGGDAWSYTPPLPDVPTALAATPLSMTSLGVSWNAADDATSYEVERSPDGETGWAAAFTGSTTGFTETGLTPDTTYYYRVRACSASGCSDWSAAAAGTTDAFLRIAGITVPVSPGGATVLAPERLGSSARTYDGELRTSVRVEKRGWRFRTAPRWAADLASLEAAVARGAFVSCSGAALGGTVSCEATLADTELVPVPGGFRKVLTIVLRET